MKKALSFALTVSLLISLAFSCITAGATTVVPKLSVVSNTYSVTAGQTAEVTLLGENFNLVAGMDITVSFPKEVELLTEVPNSKFSEEDNTLHIVRTFYNTDSNNDNKINGDDDNDVSPPKTTDNNETATNGELIGFGPWQ